MQRKRFSLQCACEPRRKYCIYCLKRRHFLCFILLQTKINYSELSDVSAENIKHNLSF